MGLLSKIFSDTRKPKGYYPKCAIHIQKYS